jgi:dimethylglycine catabolism B
MSELRRLTVLGDRQAALETCGYCPKLCRAACPVSEAEGREPLIPWGKMTMTWYVARGDLAPDPDLAELPWACTGCLACRDRCEHKNPVAPTLVAARAGYRSEGFVPAAADAALARIDARKPRIGARARELAGPRSSERAAHALLIGCGYLSGRGEEAADAVNAARALLGPVAVLSGCCGLSYREAGDPARADEERAALLSQAEGRKLVVADAGCAFELGVGTRTLAEVAAGEAGRLGRVEGLGSPVRWHDPCRLARGLGVQAEPRAVLERALGAAPAEFERRGAATACSGAGGLLPSTLPDTARAIARERLAEHERLGGGTIVTGCAASLGWFRAQKAQAVDLVTVIARSLRRG